jgi:enoyl-CoA hydratase/carnithine racemase
MTDAISLERHGSTLVLTPPVVGITARTAREIQDACTAAADDPALRALVVRAQGSALAGDWPDDATKLAGADPFGCLGALGTPTVAAIDGPVRGPGLALALACDIRIAGADATFTVSGAADGLLPGGGTLQRLARLTGRGNALYLALTGEAVNAEAALRLGLVSEVADGAFARALEIAERIAERGPLAVRFAKEAVSRGLDMTLEQALRYETDLTVILQTTEDRAEGVRAFLEKRTPEFKGK